MHKVSLATTIMNRFIPDRVIPAANQEEDHHDTSFIKGGKGQIRQAKSRRSGAAALKRASTKRKNISQHPKK